MTDRAGGCLCADIRYILHAEPIAVAICHCADCRRQSGSSFSIIATIPTTAYEQTGVAKTYVGKGDFGTVYRDFCGACGTPVVSRLAAQPDIVIVKVGTLDDPGELKPQVEVYTRSAAGWLPPFAPIRFSGPPEEAVQ